LSKEKPERLLKIGYVVKPHGINGALLLRTTGRFFLKKGQKVYLSRNDIIEGPFEAESARSHKGLILTRLKGVDDIDRVKGFRGFSACVKVKALPENFFWTDDLIGCEIHKSGGEKIGVVEEVIKTGANDILVSGDKLVPMVKDFIERINVMEKKIIVKDVPGLFDED
jgi:16S rRNA processing protein RimM